MHTMILQATHESGADEWYCPICGRRFLMQWPPNYKKIILEPGDEYAMHSGGIGGLTIEASVIEDDPSLDPWKQWTEENFDRLWNI